MVRHVRGGVLRCLQIVSECERCSAAVARELGHAMLVQRVDWLLEVNPVFYGARLDREGAQEAYNYMNALLDFAVTWRSCGGVPARWRPVSV